jgi:hypothetical protein
MTRSCPRDHFRASRVVSAMAALAFLGLLAALPARLEAQCTLSGSGSLVSFEPRPPGVSRPISLSSGYNSNLALYQSGGSGPYRLLMQEAWGYSVLDLSNPVNPTALYYHDVRYPDKGPNSVTQSGDGFQFINTVSVSPDGQRAAFSVTGPGEPFQTVVGSPDGGNDFTLWGDFPPSRAVSTLIQHIGSRYIAYDIHPFASPTASDITTLPTSSLQVDNLASYTETTAFPPGQLGALAGNYILYQSSDTIQVIDASSPGPAGSITAGYPHTTLSAANFSGRAPQYFTAAVDPADPTKLWVLVELTPLTGQTAPTYSLVSLMKGFAAPPLSAGPAIQVPSSSGDSFSSVGYASALIPSNGSLFVLMWAAKRAPTTEFRLYSTTAAAWASGAPGSFAVSGSGFYLPKMMAGFGGAGNSVYAYVPATQTAWVIPMTCVSQNAPAVASMTVANQAGAALANGATVFLGDQITITPSISPSPQTQPLTALSSLGTAQTFAVLGGSTVTNTGSSVLTGDLGVSPGSAITGFPPGIVNGTTHAGDATALGAQNAVTTAYNALAGEVCTSNLSGQDLGGMKLTPGVYCFTSSAQLTGTLTLDAQGSASAVFVFKIGSTLTTTSGSSVVVINGGSNCNVFWQVGSSATLGTGTTFAGNILALTSIALNTGASVSGRALARNGAVTLDTNTVAVCLAALGWNFDFDFHAGTPYDDNGVGTPPRLRAPDNGAIGNPALPPTTITVVGPCDYQAGGDPLSGNRCWESVTTNNASGGPDFDAVPAAGSMKPLTFAFEANNALGSAGASLFTLNWKVPAAKLQTTQILAGGALVSASDGHPTAYQWFFGPDAQHLTASCATSSCAPPSPYNTKGIYAYSLTAKYFVDQAFTTTTTGTYTVTDFAPAFTVNGATSGPIPAVTNQSLTVLNSSQSGAGISGTYQYSLCTPIPCTDTWVAWSAMADPPSSGSPPKSATIPIPATPGDYALKIKVNYTGGPAYWPDPANVTYFGLHVVSVVPLVVNVSVNPPTAPVGTTVTFSCNVTPGSGLFPYSFQWYSPYGRSVGTQQTWQTTSSVAGSVQAWCNVTDSQPTPAQSSANAIATFTGSPPPPPPPSPTALSVSVSVSPNPGTVNLPVTFSCNASGGTPGYAYVWRSPPGSPFPAGTQQTFQTSSSTPTSIQAGCTATDNAGASSSGTATVTINAAAPPAATCVDVNFTILDRDNGYISIPLSSSFIGPYFAVATGQNLVFQATGTGMSSVDWTFGEGGTGSGNPKWYTYATAGTFTATVTANSNAACSKSYRFIVAGPSGLFTARYADNSAFSSAHVESGKDLSFLATDTADSYAWNFGDGFTATGKNPTHAFNVNGSTNVTFTTTLTVTIGTLNWVTTQTFTVIPPPEPPKWFVAGLAYTPGAASGTVWQSDLAILNPDPTLSATYSLAFLDGKNPVAPKDLVWKPITLPAQQIFSASNVVSTFFEKPLGSYGAVIVRGDVAPVAPSITSRTYNNGDPGKGTFGLSVPATQATSGVSQQSSAAQQLLIGLRDDASADTNTGAYTNIGLVNLISADWSHAHLTFFDATGANLGVLNVDVPPYGVTQLTKPLTSGSWLAKPPQALYRVQVAVDPGGAVFPYATVIDQASTDPIVVTPTEQPLNTYRVPGLVRLAGANNTVWRSRFTISNPSTAGARNVHMVFSYVSCDASGCASRVSIIGDVTMNPGQTQSWDDFVKVWLTVKGHMSVDDATSYQDSFLDVSPGDSNTDPLLVLGETYNSQPTGPVGLQLSGFTDLDGGSKTSAGKRLLLTGLASNAGFRTNVAFFLTSGTSGYFNVRVLSDTGVTLKTFGWNLSDSTPFKQFSDSDLFGGVNKSDRMSIVVDSFDGSSPVAAYATIIDNTSGAPTFVKAQPAP